MVELLLMLGKSGKIGGIIRMELDFGEWKLFLKDESNTLLEEGYIEAVIRIKRRINDKQTEQAFELLKKDLQDLGKWRKFRELKMDLENE